MIALTPTQIRQIADAHVDAWMESEPNTSRGLRAHVVEAITEALTKQSDEFLSGANTLRHERDMARRDAALLAEELAALRMHLEVGH
jgi:hypothetical protein